MIPIFFLLLFLSPPTLCELPPDFQSLLEFKKGIHDPSGKVTFSWEITAPPSTWHGVSAFNSFKVTVVDLSGLNLSGELKFSTLTSLSCLQILNLSSNNFTGRLVPSIGLIQPLQNLDLSNNQFYGPVPGRIADLYSLVNLNLSNNKFESEFPTNLRNLQQLRFLDLKFNRFWGDVGSLLSEMHNVEHVDLSGNRFYGELFTESGNFSNIANTMKYMNFSGNVISGKFGRRVGLFKNLEVLDLSRNRMNGVLPELGEMLSLKVLRVGRNFLFGMIPAELFKSGMQLIEVDLSGNGFTGSVPCINSTNLKVLTLSSNSLSGSLPSSIGNCSIVDLSDNNISGDLANMQNWGNTLEVVDISSNLITGPLPSALGLYTRLSLVNFSLNKLGGPILPTLFAPLTLESLDLSDNILTGQLHPEIGKLQRINFFDIHNNNLSGELPSELSKLSKVEYIDLSGNHFVGTIPDMSHSTLKELNVSNNNFSGTVPESLTKFPSSSFYPGNNLLSFPAGSIPSERKNSVDIRVPIIIGSVGTALLIVFAIVFYILRGQDICRSYKFIDKTNSNKDAPPNVFSVKDDSKPTHGSFSNECLLSSASRSISSQQEVLTEMVEHRCTDQNSSNPVSGNMLTYLAISKSFSDSPLSSSPNFVDHQVIEQPVKLDVYSPDKFIGECISFEISLVFTADELSHALAEIIGRSSHGTSFKATLDSGHALTVKCLRADLVKHRKAFAKEAKRMGAIRHPNIVSWRCYYWGPSEQERLIVSDYVYGESLAFYLHDPAARKQSRLSVKQRLKIATEVAQSLHHLHQDRAIPHGNIKPTNIILTGPTLSARLTDYGLHRLLTPAGISEQTLNLGALGYRAPELAETKKPLPSSEADVYAFGAVLMELLTGKGAGDIISGQLGAVDLTDWVQMCCREGRAADCFDRNVAGLEESPGVMDELLAVSLKCILPATQRPDIRSVLDHLRSIAM